MTSRPKAPSASPAPPPSEAADPKPTAGNGSGPDDEIRARVRAAVAAIQDRKGLELLVLELAQVTDFTDYFLICSGASQRQVQAIAEAVLETLREQGTRPIHVEGLPSSPWVLLDFGDFLVHVFDQEQRAFYGLDRLWSDAPNVVEELSA